MRFVVLAVLATSISLLCSCGEVRTQVQMQIQQVHPTALKQAIVYDRAIGWFAKNMNDSNAVLRIQDKEAGTIMGRCIIPGGVCTAVIGTPGPLCVDIRIDIKDAKYRITLDNLAYKTSTGERDLDTDGEWDSALATCKRLEGDLSAAIDSNHDKDF